MYSLKTIEVDKVETLTYLGNSFDIVMKEDSPKTFNDFFKLKNDKVTIDFIIGFIVTSEIEQITLYAHCEYTIHTDKIFHI
jgi:hypothetical protein